MVEFPDEDRQEATVVTDGYFEQETLLSREATAALLRDLADQIEAEPRLSISGSDWEIPFEYREPIEVEVEFVGERTHELEIEFEFEAPKEGSDLSID